QDVAGVVGRSGNSSYKRKCRGTAAGCLAAWVRCYTPVATGSGYAVYRNLDQGEGRQSHHEQDIAQQAAAIRFVRAGPSQRSQPGHDQEQDQQAFARGKPHRGEGSCGQPLLGPGQRPKATAAIQWSQRQEIEEIDPGTGPGNGCPDGPTTSQEDPIGDQRR